MLKLLQIIFYLFVSLITYSQRLDGRVIDSRTKIGVSFASIGFLKTNQGTTATENGSFRLDLPLNSFNDTLIISSVGYKSKKVKIEKGSTSYEILLDKTEPVLREVVIRKYLTKLTLPWNNGKTNQTLSTMGQNTQVARLLEAPTTNCRLESVTIATGHRSILGPGKKESRFRIRIYEYDTIRNLPGVDLCDSVIEVFGRGVISVKLDKYKIIIPQKRFFVAVQWLLIDENKEQAKKDNAQSVDYFFYKPSVRVEKVSADKGNSWWQYHDQHWLKWSYETSITATIYY
jgi:hypothetical protein